MYKFVMDADGLIKLAKSSLIQQIANHITCLISDDVYREVVIKGEERLYEDAFAIGELVRKGKITKIKTRKSESHGLSSGEMSALELYKERKADGIISDDRKFLSLLESEGIPFLIPTHLIVMMVGLAKIRKEDAMRALEKIKPFIREDAYQEALQHIGGERHE